MQAEPKVYHVPDDSELAQLLEASGDAPVLLERRGRRYLVNLDYNQPIPPREQVTMEELLQRMQRVFQGIDVEQLKRDLDEARGQRDGGLSSEDPWEHYDAEQVQVGIRRMAGIFRDIDTEELKRDVYAWRGQDSTGRPATTGLPD